MSTSSDYWVDFWRLHGRESRDGGVHEQVLRVKNKQAIDESLWQKTLEAIGQLLEVNATDKVLDLCCGNGLIVRSMQPACLRIHQAG